MGATCSQPAKKETTRPHRRRREDDDIPYSVLEILDSAGQEEFSALRDVEFRDVDGFLLTYSVTDVNSFKEVKRIYTRLCSIKNRREIPAVLCGNKCDLTRDRKVSVQQGKDLAKQLNIPFYETSAKDDVNVKQIFDAIVIQIPKYESSYKIAMNGEGGVGKSSLTVRFSTGNFLDESDATIEDSYRVRIANKPSWHDPRRTLNLNMEIDNLIEYEERAAISDERNKERAAITTPEAEKQGPDVEQSAAV